MIYLDTHVVVWLYAGRGENLSNRALQLIEESATVLVSPMVLLELEYLHETDRITLESNVIFDYLHQHIGLKVCERPFNDVIRLASKQVWTRDPFDRIITGQAAVAQNYLITKDAIIRRHYAQATW